VPEHGAGSNTPVIVMVVIGIIAAIALFSNDTAEEGYPSLPNP
jgi:hypothetical protein